MLTLSLLLTLFTAAPKFAPPPEPASLVSVRVAPKVSSAKPPLVVMLHGLASNEQEFAPLASSLDPHFDYRVARAPLIMGPEVALKWSVGKPGWFEMRGTPQSRTPVMADVQKSTAKILAFVDEAIAADEADPKRVFIVGFSQGAYMALTCGLAAPQKFAGIVVMSGWMPQVDDKALAAAAKRKLPVLVVHGTADPLLPGAGAEIEDALKRAGVPVEYREFPMRHQVSAESMAVVNEWLRTRAGLKSK